MEFNDAQRAALSHKEGPMMVLAGPGSGKTTVITHRIQRLLEQGVSPSGILVITFTKAAAVEMKARFLKLGDQGGVLVRPCGTAPLVRVLVEGADYAQIEEIAGLIAGAIEARQN